MRLLLRICICIILTILVGCREQSLSKEQRLLAMLYPSVVTSATDRSQVPFRYSAKDFPGQPTKSIVVSWGSIPGLPPNKTAELAVLNDDGGRLTLLARSPIGLNDWPGDGELSDVELSSETYSLNSQTNAFAVRIVRKSTELQPPLYIESLALYDLANKSLKRMLYHVAGFYENDPGDPKAVRADLKIADMQASGFLDLFLSDHKGGSTHFRWNGLEYVPSLSSSGQKQRIRLVSVHEVSGSGPNLEMSGKGFAIINDGSGAYMWGSSTPPDVEVSLSVTDAIAPLLCSNLAHTGIPSGKAIELNGIGVFENLGNRTNLFARFKLSSLYSCEWVGLSAQN